MMHSTAISGSSPIIARRNSRRLAVTFAVSQYPLALLLVLLTTAASLAEPAPAPREVRESAVRQARSGDPKGALLILQELVRSYPDDPALLADTTIVANWAGDDSFALELYARKQTPKDNSGVTEAAARSARNLHQYDLALELYRRVEAFAPDRWQAQLGSAMVLTDQGKYSAAASLMKPLLQKEGSEPDIERGQAYLCLRQQDFSCAIIMYQRLLEQAPIERKALQCQLANAISQLGGNTLAQSMCDPADTSESLRLNAATGAERVRWAESNDHSWQERKADAEQALALLNAVIAASHPEDVAWRGAQYDRLLAFHDLYRMRDVVQSWEYLHHLGLDVPDYALTRVAAAYLALHHPHEAETLYRDLVRRSPDNGDLWSGLAYAEFESEHIREAFQTIDQAYRNTPAWLQSPGLKVPQPNAFYASLATQAAQMRGYADMPAEEQARLTDLLGQAPASPALRHAMAMTYLARGWPLLAMKEERMADNFEQKDDLPVLEDAKILEVAGRRKEVDALLGPLLKREGESPSVDRFLGERAIELGWQSNISWGYEWSNGQYLGNSQHSEAHFYSPFMNDRWRVYAHALGDSGRFVAGSAYRSRAALGISYSYNRQSVWGEVAGDTGNAGSVVAGAIGAQFSLGDHWIFGAEGDTDKVTDVQLITQLAGVRARSAGVSVDWRQSELRSFRAGLQRMLYSDGNQRSVLSGAWNQRVWTQPRLQIDINPQVWASANSEDQNRVYFNPKHDFSLGSSATVNWVTWRRYDRNLRQQFTVYAGPYWEENYGVTGAVSASYTQHWKVSKRLGFVGQIAWNGQPYDGNREPYTDLSFGLTWGAQ
jgi:biofilm PGA synthesis protein PgaA